MTDLAVVDSPVPAVKAAASAAVPTAALEAALAAQRTAFGREMNPSLAARRDRLDRLLRLVASHEGAIVDAVSADFGHRSRHETGLADIFVVLS
ncbi:MAG TPA: hypothetical protein VET86_14695, partial [Casimicrobiaceae bacterium]|nr:hypothetical protein [Casimicrobiaceae bacterium]